MEVILIDSVLTIEPDWHVHLSRFIPDRFYIINCTGVGNWFGFVSEICASKLSKFGLIASNKIVIL